MERVKGRWKSVEQGIVMGVVGLIFMAPCAWAGADASGVMYGVIGLLGLGVMVAAAIAWWRVIEWVQARQKRAIEVAQEDLGSQENKLSVEGTQVKAQMLDILELPDGVVVYVLRISDRVVLIGKHKYGIASLGDFPASWIEEPGQVAPATYRPAPIGNRAQSSGRTSSVIERLARDEREWERRREELIRLLQEGGQ